MGLLLFIVIASAGPVRAFAGARNSNLYIYRPLTGIAEVMRYAQRKTLEVPVLRIVSDNKQRKAGDETDGNSNDTLLQRLQTQVHTQEPEDRFDGG